jgi:hypothetical protein
MRLKRQVFKKIGLVKVVGGSKFDRHESYRDRSDRHQVGRDKLGRHNMFGRGDLRKGRFERSKNPTQRVGEKIVERVTVQSSRC